MKKCYRLVAILLLLSAIVIGAVAFACKQKNEGQSSSSIGVDTEQTYPTATTKVYSVPNGVDLYGGAELYVNGEEVPLYRTKYNQEQVWSAEASNRKDTGFAYFDFDGEVEIKIVYATEQYKAFLVRPSAYKVFPKYNESENSVTFTLKHADNYVVEPVQNCKQVIYLF